MVSKSIVLLALSASVAVASPFGHARFHGTGMRGTGGRAWPTGGHGHYNGSESGIAYPSSGHKTFTVNPTSEASSSLDLEDDTPSTAVAAASDTTSTCYSTSTEYETTINYITVTAGPGRDAASASSTTVSLSIVSPVNAAAQNQNWPSNGQGRGWPSTTMATHVSSASPSSESSVAASPVVVSTSKASAQTSAATTVAVSVSSAASSAAATTSASSGSSSGGKKGLSYNTNSLLNLFSGAGASWTYNWGSSAGGSIPSGLEYVPMCWGKDQAAGCASAVLATGASHMLSFNEPDNSGQANLDPATAAQLHIKNIASPLAGKVKIGSPAVTNSGTSGQGLSWLSQFLAACNPTKSADACKLDFLVVHWYSDAQYYSTFESHVQGAIDLAKQYGIPGNSVWVTEFAATGSASDQVSFMSKAIPWLESTSAVSRYAYFMVDPLGEFGMTSGSALNSVGKAYVA